jgi:hypothetical protein
MCEHCNGCKQVKKVQSAIEALVGGLKEISKQGIPYVKKMVEAIESELKKDYDETSKKD